MAAVKCSEHLLNEHDDTLVKLDLPEDFDQIVCKFGEELTTVRIAATTGDDAIDWLDAYSQKQKTTWRIKKTIPVEGKKILFKTHYRCQHKTRTKESKYRSKNTDCPAEVHIKVKSNQRADRDRVTCSRSKDCHIWTHPTIINIRGKHNHPVHCADALRYRDVSQEANQRLEALFRASYSPTAALDTLMHDLQLREGDRYVFESADRAICPDIAYCYRLYKKIFNKDYGASEGPEMLDKLTSNLEEYNKRCKSVCANWKTGNEDGNHMVIALCTPLMKRVHTMLNHSAEMCFIDSTGNLDRHGCRLFILLTHSVAGGLPLGVLITTSESEDAILEALQLLLEILPKGAFGGRGQRGPELFVTDDSTSERQAVHRAFPEAKLMLCTFHLLQALWRWLWSASHSILKDDRPELLRLVKSMVFAQDLDDLQKQHQNFMDNTTVERYPNFKIHVDKLYTRRTDWALCYRNSMPTRGNNTNNYAEAAMRVLKDKIFLRTKAYNVPQLVDFMYTRLEGYYERKVQLVANGRYDNVQTSKFMPKDKGIKLEDINKIDAGHFTVKSQSIEAIYYHVDMELGICDCRMGKTGNGCKHQAAIVLHYNVSSCNFIPVNNPQMRANLLTIATGQDNVPISWFQPLKEVQACNSTVNDPLMVPTNDEQEVIPDTSGQAGGESNNTNEVDLANDNADLQAKLGDINVLLCNKIGTSPEMNEAISEFCSSILKTKTDATLISSLRMFGKDHQRKARHIPSKQQRQGAFRSVGGASIPVSSTTISRRKELPLGGRKRLHSGRKSQRLCTSPAPKKRTRNPAAHNLAQNVSKNQSMGRTHSTK